ncbi:MAG: glycosyltransferase [Candidatus Kapabacteria bacterium]|nr:glycosyltransferase [Candidatus Kapabacteria bacterium]
MEQLPRLGKVLILSASAGAGHVRAADALVQAFHSEGAAREIYHLDTLQYTTKALRNVYSKAYIEMANKAPELLGWIYDVTDKVRKPEKRMQALERLNVGLFMRLLKRHQPDLVVNTHFLPADIITHLRHREKLTCKQAVVVTDFDVHSLWFNPSVEYYFTACEEARVYMSAMGINAGNIHTTGIPIDSSFGITVDKKTARRTLGLDADIPVVIISAGGFGVGNMEQILQSLMQTRNPVTVLAMCGRNAELKERVESLQLTQQSAQSKSRIVPVGFTTAMHDYMSAADIMIGKPGGLTASESLAKGLAMVIINPIPGQEERNSDYLLEQGAAVKCNNLPTLAYKLDSLLDSPERLVAMQLSALRTATPHAARDIVRILRRSAQ